MPVQEGKRIEVAKIPPSKSDGPREILARLCYLYPQYTLAQAKKLSYRDVLLLLKMAHRVDSERYFNLTNIAAAPQTEKMKGVKKLLSNYKKEAHG